MSTGGPVVQRGILVQRFRVVTLPGSRCAPGVHRAWTPSRVIYPGARPPAVGSPPRSLGRACN